VQAPGGFVMAAAAPKKRRSGAQHRELALHEQYTKDQQYAQTVVIRAVRPEVDRWRALPNSNDWKVTPEKAPAAARGASRLCYGAAVLLPTRRR
jgi:hypothetical protein